MQAIALSDARRRFAEVAAQAEEEPAFITRAGKPTLVLLRASELAATAETAHLLSTEANRGHLLQALRDVEQGRTVRVNPDDL